MKYIITTVFSIALYWSFAEADTTTQSVEQQETLKEVSLLSSQWDSLHVAMLQQNTPSVDSISVLPTDSQFYIDRLQAIPTDFPLPYNDLVKSMIQRYLKYGQTAWMSKMIGAGENYYFRIVEPMLEKEGMPLELKYISVVESALDPNAVSRVGAVGLWQFMIGTGKDFGLEINTLIDERRDPHKSSEAAVRYLKFLYGMYDDWLLAFAAYNSGPGNVNKAIYRAKGKKDFWEIYPYLPRETRGYVPTFIAAVYLYNYYHEHGITPTMPEIALVDTVEVKDKIHLEQVSTILGVEIKTLRELNPQFRRDVIPSSSRKTYSIYLPVEQSIAFIANYDTIMKHDREKHLKTLEMTRKPSRYSNTAVPLAKVKGKEIVSYTIKSGDNLGYIADWFDTSPSKIRYWNNIRGNKIRAGQKIQLYVPDSKASFYKRINTLSFDQKMRMPNVVSSYNPQT